jgi:hypothetical protein
VRLDRQDEVRIQVKGVRGVPELVKADHGRALRRGDGSIRSSAGGAEL